MDDATTLTAGRRRSQNLCSIRRETASPSLVDRSAVFQARALTKIYRMGDVEVPALQSVDLDPYAGERARR